MKLPYIVPTFWRWNTSDSKPFTHILFENIVAYLQQIKSLISRSLWQQGKKLFCCLLLCWAMPLMATDIKQAQVTLQNHRYELSADIDYRLSNRAKEAIENGVPLFWNLHIKVSQQRDYWWSKTLLDLKVRYRLQYHALLNMYRVVVIQDDNPLLGKQQQTNSHNFSTLSAALDLMESLYGFPLLKQTQLEANKHYVVEIKAEFDTDALPLPLRPIAYTNPQWYLSSDWTVWQLKK